MSSRNGYQSVQERNCETSCGNDMKKGHMCQKNHESEKCEQKSVMAVARGDRRSIRETEEEFEIDLMIDSGAGTTISPTDVIPGKSQGN